MTGDQEPSPETIARTATTAPGWEIGREYDGSYLLEMPDDAVVQPRQHREGNAVTAAVALQGCVGNCEPFRLVSLPEETK